MASGKAQGTNSGEPVNKEQKIAALHRDFSSEEINAGTSSDPIGSGNEVAQNNAQHNPEPIPRQLTCKSLIDPFTVMLFKLSQDISNDKLKDLKRLCKGQKMLNERELESLENPYDLFDKLRSKDLIHEKDTRLVHYLLQIIDLNALVEKHIKPSANQGTLSNKTAILVEHLKDKYKRHYSKLLPIPWNEDIYLNLQEVYTTLEVTEMKKGGLKMGTTLENPHDMFKSLDTRRIRIEGAPAMGKSTLSRKLAYDWSCGELQQYTLLFFLEMRHIAKNNMVDEIFNQLIPDDFKLSKEEVSEVVSMNIVSVLFLCDGLDEPDKHKVTNSEIPKLISENLYSWSTVVVTTRPYLCNQYLRKCDLHLLVKGFTSERKDEYILKYFKDDTERGDSLIKQIKSQEENHEFLIDLLKNPLHVTFLCILWEYHKAKSYYFPETLTKLYSEILECILKRYCEKNNIESENDEIPENVLCDRDTLASDSYNAYRKEKTNFDRSEISSEATLNFGLLVKDLGHAMRKSEQIYFFYHMTWLEYFTALHVNSQLKSNNTKTLKKFLKRPRKHLQVLKFMAGIVTKEEGKLFFDELNNNLYEEVLNLSGRNEEEEVESPLDLYGNFIEFLLESKYPEDFITCFNVLTKGTIVYSHTNDTPHESSTHNFLFGLELQNVITLDGECLSFQDFLLMLQLISKTDITFDTLYVHGLYDKINSCLEVLKENPIHVRSLTIQSETEWTLNDIDNLTGIMKNFRGEIIALSLNVDAASGGNNNALKQLIKTIQGNKSLKCFKFEAYQWDDILQTMTYSGTQEIICINCDGFSLTDASVNALCSFLKNCDTTESLKLSMGNFSQPHLMKIKEALKTISPSLKSLHFLRCQHGLYNALTDMTLNDIGMWITVDSFSEDKIYPEDETDCKDELGNEDETDHRDETDGEDKTDGEGEIGNGRKTHLGSACSIIEHNKYANSMTLYIYCLVDDDEYDVATNFIGHHLQASLRQNKVLKHLKIIHMVRGENSLIGLLRELSKDIETNQCTLDSITLIARNTVVDNKGDDIVAVISRQEIARNRHHQVNTSVTEVYYHLIPTHVIII